MIHLKLISILLFGLLIQSCSNRTESVASKQFKDGLYCARVKIVDQNSNTREDKQLNIEVKNNEVRKVLFNNSDLPDDDSFKPAKLVLNGVCSFTNNNGTKYKVEITGTECIFIFQPATIKYEASNQTSSGNAENNNKCPVCGGVILSIWNSCPNCARISVNNKEKKSHDKIGAVCPECGEYDEEIEEGDDMCAECLRKERLKNQSKEDDDDN